ncbi:tRNA (N(6)-L-threonylcarbamoyladenosine(37)-C(2))-methylthiotransferase MtaB [Candidatus Omnitrophota bacterium]
MRGKGIFYIKTLGCKVNQYESQIMRERFLKRGYLETEDVDRADICIVNTCTVTSTSDTKSFRLIRSAVRKKKRVIATGCMIEDRDLDLSKLTGVKFVIKNKDKYKIPEIIEGAQKVDNGKGIYGISGLKGHTRVFVKIQDGCDNACSYCKVRDVRGQSKSRPFKEVIGECVTLIKGGAKEIVLSGICLGAYGRDLSRGLLLHELIKEICKIDGDWRLRLSSIEPKDIDKDLISQFRSQDKLCKHLHVPFQCGDNYILKKMHRPYTKAGYLNIVDRIKDAVPDIAIGTDIMVGFPGETEKRYQNTLDFIKEVRPMRIHVFPFSKRQGTKAYGYADNIASAVKEKREDNLLRLATRLSREFVDKFIDKKVRVLVEDKKTKDGYLQGYTDAYIKVYINGPASLRGRFVNCLLTLTKDKPCGILPLYYFNSPF